jgi:hypothetical protein
MMFRINAQPKPLPNSTPSGGRMIENDTPKTHTDSVQAHSLKIKEDSL